MSKVVESLQMSTLQVYQAFWMKIDYFILVTILFVNILSIHKPFTRDLEAFVGYVQYVMAECLLDGDCL